MYLNRCSLLLLALVASPGVTAEDPPADPAADKVVERVPLHTVVPVYPEKARQARVEGEVEVCFNVDRFGRTKGVSVRRSTNRVFEKPARNAVRASTFHPLEPGQKLPDIKNCRTFTFTLERVAIDKQ
ncbi:MAG: TonB family protein [Woeseiaceae bacterium]|nr:TonB family protein [Woeseiaceae bacterium]